MVVQRTTLDNLLLQNVCEIRFVRRIPIVGRSATRRMWCTKSYNLLNSVNGLISLNYKPPTGPKRINEAIENVVIVWDILMQDYRTVSIDRCNLLQTIPADDTFWKYFNENLYPLTAKQKIEFMEQ